MRFSKPRTTSRLRRPISVSDRHDALYPDRPAQQPGWLLSLSSPRPPCQMVTVMIVAGHHVLLRIMWRRAVRSLRSPSFKTIDSQQRNQPPQNHRGRHDRPDVQRRPCHRKKAHGRSQPDRLQSIDERQREQCAQAQVDGSLHAHPLVNHNPPILDRGDLRHIEKPRALARRACNVPRPAAIEWAQDAEHRPTPSRRPTRPHEPSRADCPRRTTSPSATISAPAFTSPMITIDPG